MDSTGFAIYIKRKTIKESLYEPKQVIDRSIY